MVNKFACKNLQVGGGGGGGGGEENEPKAVQRLFTRHFACYICCENLFTCSRRHNLMQFLT